MTIQNVRLAVTRKRNDSNSILITLTFAKHNLRTQSQYGTRKKQSLNELTAQ
jgi:hypothetical protein